MIDNAQEWIALIGLILSLSTTIIIPIYKKYKKKKNEQIKRQNKQDLMFEKIETMEEKITLLTTNQEKSHDDLQKFFQDYDEFSTQNLKYMINDAYFCYDSIEDIPDDILLNACECCDIYVYKRNKNHEIRPRCEKLWAELENRAVNREVHHV